MKRTWHGLAVVTMALSLLASGVPAAAKHESLREGNANIEAKDSLSLQTAEGKHLSEAGRSSRLVIVTFAGPIEEEWKEAVEEMGVSLGDYIPDFAFIAKLPAGFDQKRLKALSFVERVYPFYNAYKLAPGLRKALDDKEARDVVVVGFDGQKDMSRAVKQAAPHAESLDESATKSRRLARLSADGETIAKLLESDDVIAVLPVGKRKLYNNVAAGIIHADTLRTTGYTGKNQIVGVADSGLDTGDPAHIHPDFAGQIVKLIPVGRPDDASDRHGHGTHVAGSILGTGKASNGKYKGMAPDAKLVFHAMDDEQGELQGDLATMWTEAYQLGARIHSDSWGTDSYGEYTQDSYEADEFLWNHKDMTALVAAGNNGEYGWQTVISPATAKNVIAVGASESVRFHEDVSDNPDEVAYFSSRGPTADGRFKPDIVAPGTYILSTRSSLAPDDHFWSPFNQKYAYMGGTSMATPVLAGGVAQVRQFLNEKGIASPSSALIKAMLITGADDLRLGLFEQGFGRANLQAAIATTFADQTVGMKTNDTATYTIQVTDTSKPFVTTLVWTDYPGLPTATRQLVNDLNLVVKTPSGKVYNGNDMFEAPFNDEVDNVNNVEQVYLPQPEAGTYTVTITAYNVPKGPQPYALATTGQLQSTSQVKEEKKIGTVTSTKGAGNKRYLEYKLNVTQPGKIKLSLTWDSKADLDLYLKDSKGKTVAKSLTKQKPEALEYDVTEAGTYKVRVYAKSGGAAKFTLTMSYPGN